MSDPARAAPDNLPRAAVLMIAAATAFAAMGACVQIATRSLPLAEVVFMRNVLGLAFFVPWLARHGIGAALRTQKPFEHLVRTVAGLLSMYCSFFTMARLRLADAVLLNTTLPLFVPIVEALWLRHPMPARLWPALLLGFAGVALVLRPGGDLFQPVALVGLSAGLLSAVAQTGIRRLTETDPPERIIFIFTAASSLLSAAPVPAVWVAPTAGVAALLVLIALFATVGQIGMTRAYAHAPAAQVGAFIYAAVLFAALFDWARTRNPPQPLFVAGAVLICCAGALMLRLSPQNTIHGRGRKYSS